MQTELEGQKLLEEIVKKLSERPCSVSTLASELNLRRDFLAGFLEAMKLHGELEVVHVGKAKVYIPTEKARRVLEKGVAKR